MTEKQRLRLIRLVLIGVEMKLCADRDRFMKGTQAKNDKDQYVSAMSPDACRYSFYAAHQLVSNRIDADHVDINIDILMIYNYFCRTTHGCTFYEWLQHNQRTHIHVKNFLHRVVREFNKMIRSGKSVTFFYNPPALKPKVIRLPGHTK